MIEKLRQEYKDCQNYISASSKEDIIDKINEIIDFLNDKQEEENEAR